MALLWQLQLHSDHQPSAAGIRDVRQLPVHRHSHGFPNPVTTKPGTGSGSCHSPQQEGKKISKKGALSPRHFEPRGHKANHSALPRSCWMRSPAAKQYFFFSLIDLHIVKVGSEKKRAKAKLFCLDYNICFHKIEKVLLEHI